MKQLIVFLCTTLLAGAALAQEKFTGSNVDIRMSLAFKAPDAAIQRLIPAGWELNSPTSGPTRGANLNVSVLDQQSAQDPEGKPVTPYRGVALTIPVKKTGSDAAGSMVVEGLFSPSNAPGAYGVFLPAKVTLDRRVRTDAEGKTSVEESWQLMSDDGHALQIRVAYVRGTATRVKVESKVYSGARPDFFRIYRYEAATDVVRSTATGVDRVSAFSLKASGQKLAPIFDGSEQLIAVTSIPWYSRQVYVPGL